MEDLFMKIVQLSCTEKDAGRDMLVVLKCCIHRLYWSNIFTFDRRCAHLLVLEKFADCLNYISSINIHESEY